MYQYQVKRLILPSSLFVCGFIIFLCGLVRTFHIGEKMPTNDIEKKNIQAYNEYVEWWIGFPVSLFMKLVYVTVLSFKVAVYNQQRCFFIRCNRKKVLEP